MSSSMWLSKTIYETDNATQKKKKNNANKYRDPYIVPGGGATNKDGTLGWRLIYIRSLYCEEIHVKIVFWNALIFTISIEIYTLQTLIENNYYVTLDFHRFVYNLV